MPPNSRNISELYQFNLKHLLSLLAGALLLVGSWCLCGAQCCTFKNDHSLRASLWNRVDLAAFRLFNRWLLTHDPHRWIAKLFVALNSVGIGEMISNLTIVLVTSVIFSSKYIFQHQTRSFKVAVVLAMIIYGMAGQMVLSKLSRDYLCPNRPSPAVVFRFSTVSLESQAVASTSSSFTIDRLFEEAKKRDLVKEIAYDSWPGEHAAVNFIWSLFMSIIISRSSSSLSRTKRLSMYFIIWLVAVLLSVARVVSGAHWLSDCLAGGLSEALVVVAIGVYTPVLQLCTKLLHRLMQGSSKTEKKLP